MFLKTHSHLLEAVRTRSSLPSLLSHRELQIERWTSRSRSNHTRALAFVFTSSCLPFRKKSASESSSSGVLVGLRSQTGFDKWGRRPWSKRQNIHALRGTENKLLWMKETVRTGCSACFSPVSFQPPFSFSVLQPLHTCFGLCWCVLVRHLFHIGYTPRPCSHRLCFLSEHILWHHSDGPSPESDSIS